MIFRLSREIENATRALQGFYLVLCLENFAKISSNYQELSQVFRPSIFAEFLNLISVESGILFVQVLYVPAMICAAAAPLHFCTRFIAAVVQFLLTAYLYGLGFDYHGLLPQMYVCISLALILPLSAELRSLSQRARFLVSFKVVMFIALLHYTISGFWKFAYAFVVQPLGGTPGIFSWDAYAYIATGYLAQSGVEPLFFDWTIKNSPLMTVLFAFAIYFEMFVWVGILRPATAKIFALGLLAMHTFALFGLGINFKDSIPLLIFFLFLHPTDVRYSLKQGLKELPIVKWILIRCSRGLANA